MKHIFSFFFLFFTISFFAQELKDYSPKSPEATALDKFIDIPPGSYTGTAGYSVPLYNIEVDGYSIPIMLNYHGMGIKVNDVSSSVGLGWSISIAGVALSQRVIGEQDEYTNRLNVNLNSFQPQKNGINYTNGDHYDDAYIMTRPLLGTPNIELELQPDYYSYNLLNNSGKFIIDSQDIGHTIPKDDIKIIEPTLIIDNHGIKYQFTTMHDGSGAVIYKQNGDPSLSKIPSYNINTITFPSGKEINFEYINSSLDYLGNYTETESRRDMNVSDIIDSNKIFNSDVALCSSLNTSISIPRYLINERVLSKITFDNGEINFEYAPNDREDIGGKALKGIKAINTNGIVFRDFTLSNSYLISPEDPGVHLTEDNQYYSGVFKRLVLNEVKEEISNKKYSFEYYDNYILPNRFSKSVDYWGVFNGINNRSYIHEYTYKDENNISRVREGADKSPDINYAQIGSLKKVNLPTGGSQEFKYELDDYKFDGTENQFYKREHLVPVTDAMFNNNSAIIPLNISGLDYRDGFNYKLEFYWSDNTLDESNIHDLPLAGTIFYNVELINQNNNNILPDPLYHNIEIDIPELSQDNTYSFRFNRVGGLLNNAILWAKLTWYQNNTQYVANKNTGNLRINSITLKDTDGNIALKRNYNYKNPDSTQFSSGVYKDFKKFNFSEYPADMDISLVCRYKNVSSSFNTNATTFRGKSVVYKYVTEEFVYPSDTSKSYYIQKQFSTPNPLPLDYYKVPSIPDIDKSFYGGFLIHQKELNNQFEKVSETEYKYEFDNFFASESLDNNQGIPSNGLSLGITIEHKATNILFNSSNGFNLYEHHYNWHHYYYPTTWVKLNETNTKSYFNNGSFVEQKTTYQYDSSYRHIKPTGKTTTNSSGETIKTEYSYPQELISEPNALHLVNTNRISNPLETRNYKDNIGVLQLLSKNKTVYNDWGNNIIEPKFIKTLKWNSTTSTNSLDSRITYHKYDSYGNPLEVSKAEGTLITYIWGYNKQYPVAKIENATYTEIESVLGVGFDLGSSGLTPTQETSLRDSDLLSNAFISTYTYDPLIGVTSMTDPKGYTMYYEYDEFNRLKHVKDAQGNILSENEYHYANQN